MAEFKDLAGFGGDEVDGAAGHGHGGEGLSGFVVHGEGGGRGGIGWAGLEVLVGGWKCNESWSEG